MARCASNSATAYLSPVAGSGRLRKTEAANFNLAPVPDSGSVSRGAREPAVRDFGAAIGRLCRCRCSLAIQLFNSSLSFQHDIPTMYKLTLVIFKCTESFFRAPDAGLAYRQFGASHQQRSANGCSVELRSRTTNRDRANRKTFAKWVIWGHLGSSDPTAAG